MLPDENERGIAPLHFSMTDAVMRFKAIFLSSPCFGLMFWVRHFH